MRTSYFLLALTAGAAITGAAIAQPAPMREARPDFAAMRDAHTRQRVDDLRTILRLQPDQEPALQAFLKTRMDRRGGHEGPPAMPRALPTPERMDEMTRRQSERAAMGQQRAEAVKTFYAALSPDQRQVFDALARMRGGPERRMAMMDRHGPPGMGRGHDRPPR